MTEISIDELKYLQLNILNAVDLFCRNNCIEYSLAYGTLLGAVRHGGYIPWDDDIDIMMPRKDFEKFISSFRHNRYKVLSYPNNKEFLYPYAKVSDISTILIEERTGTTELGVNIDVFPIDKSLNQDKMASWLRKKYIIQSLYTLKMLKLSKDRGILKNTVILITRIISSAVSQGFLCRKIQNMAQEYKDLTTDYMGILSTADTKLKWIMPANIFTNYKDIAFEGKYYKCINDTDAYLKNTYGNYMQLPPEHLRITHHGFKAYMK